jgi:phytoene synthase
MADSLERAIFRKGSTTYFWSTAFFPKDIREDVFRLYSFVRTADDYVDTVQPDNAGFIALRSAWSQAAHDQAFVATPEAGDALHERVVKNMVGVCRKYRFDPLWVEAFLDAMQSDLDGKQYRTWDDTLDYMYGSAEVIALMMCQIMGVRTEAQESARMLGRAMQYINFIRDIKEDIALGRCYFPETELRMYGVGGVAEFKARPELFDDFVRAQLKRYRIWQAVGERGYPHLPGRLLIPVKTASDMYGWTAAVIDKEPKLVFERKIKPTRGGVMLAGLKNSLRR